MPKRVQKRVQIQEQKQGQAQVQVEQEGATSGWLRESGGSC